MTRTLPVCISGLALLLLACGGLTFISSPTPIPTWTPSMPPSPTETATAAPTASPTHTATLPPSETPSPTLTPTLTAYLRGPGEINVPILLYHHIGVSRKGDTIYYISPDMFDREMNLLYQWGYRTISVELLVRAIREGAELPARPIILTFDDGSETVHSAALPIMQRYGFTGTAYIVHNYVGIPGFMDVDQIRELYESGWEIGSHGLSHQDLPKHPARQRNEIVSSRRKLESLLDLPVASFSYPFGAYDSDSLYYVHYVDYIAAMGLGEETVQGSDNLFYLYRQPVTGTDDLAAFAALLPWQGYTLNLPALTIVP
ncbi:MAG: polysaccharide deacetylase family protein [Anaerolineales bacterium]